MVADEKCWNCDNLLEPNQFFCVNCKKIQAPNFSDEFELLNIEKKYNLKGLMEGQNKINE